MSFLRFRAPNGSSDIFGGFVSRQSVSTETKILVSVTGIYTRAIKTDAHKYSSVRWIVNTYFHIRRIYTRVFMYVCMYVSVWSTRTIHGYFIWPRWTVSKSPAAIRG